MLTIFNLQWLRLKREPALAIIFFLMTLAFVFFIVGTAGGETITVPTYSRNLSQAQMEEWIDSLNDSDAFIFEIRDIETIEDEIRMSQISFALELDKDNYRFLLGHDSQYITAINQHVENVYRTKLRIDEVNEQFPASDITRQDFIEIETRTLMEIGDANIPEGYANVIVGMTLYFSVFTILFGLMNIAQEKKSGTWNRLITTPLRKSQIYIGQLSHYLLIGVLQIGIAFFVFHQFFNYNFGHQYLSIIVSVLAFVFAVVALGMLIIALIKSPQQLQAVIPIVSTSMAMLGGAFWPLEIVSNRILLLLGKMTPLYHGIEALKGAIVYNRGLDEILQPLSILLLMGVLLMGLGLNLMEGKRQ